jgi:hypothetical protein
MKWVVFFGWPVAATLVLRAMEFHSDQGPWVAGLLLGLGSLAAMCALGVFTCPRCGARMYVRTQLRDPSPDGCRSCGIDVGTPKYPT